MCQTWGKGVHYIHLTGGFLREGVGLKGGARGMPDFIGAQPSITNQLCYKVPKDLKAKLNGKVNSTR